MTARMSGWRRPPILTTTRITFALVVAALAIPMLLLALAGFGPGWALVGYLALAVLTVWTLRGARREAGTGLGRRVVRRGLVVALLADCVALAVMPSGAAPLLVLLVVLLNVALGWGTLRLAGAPDGAVDERQEWLRNRSHRIAYWVFAALVGGTLVVAQVASPATRSWLAGALTSGGAIVAFFELLFVLPGMVVAWLEPDHLAPETAEPALDRRTLLGLAMLGLAVALPAALSVGLVVLPLRTTSTVKPLPAVGANRCVDLMASARAGVVVDAEIPVHAVICGDGRTASERWGVNQSDCLIASASLATVVPTRCSRTIDPDGTLRFTYGAMVRPALLPFLGREVTMRVVVDRDGRVVRFP